MEVIKVYEIPVMERFTCIGTGNTGGLPDNGCCKYMCVDGVGFAAYYRKEEAHLLTVKNARRHLMGGRGLKVFIVADNCEEAVKKFYSEYEGTQVGGDKTKESKALRIDADDNDFRFIMEYVCEGIKTGGVYDFSCKDPNDIFDPEFPCTLDGYDSFDECPVNVAREIFSDLSMHDGHYDDKDKRIPVKRVFGQFRYVPFFELLKAGKKYLKMDLKETEMFCGQGVYYK